MFVVGSPASDGMSCSLRGIDFSLDAIGNLIAVRSLQAGAKARVPDAPLLFGMSELIFR